MQIGFPIAWRHETVFIHHGHESNCEQSPEAVPSKAAWNQAGSLWNAQPNSSVCTNAHPLTTEALRKVEYKDCFQELYTYSLVRGWSLLCLYWTISISKLHNSLTKYCQQHDSLLLCVGAFGTQRFRIRCLFLFWWLVFVFCLLLWLTLSF